MGSVIFSYRSPLPFAHIRAPSFKGYGFFIIGFYALVLCSQWLTYATLPLLLRFELAEPAPDGALTKLHVFADLVDAQALDFDHLRYMELEAGI